MGPKRKIAQDTLTPNKRPKIEPTNSSENPASTQQIADRLELKTQPENKITYRYEPNLLIKTSDGKHFQVQRLTEEKQDPTKIAGVLAVDLDETLINVIKTLQPDGKYKHEYTFKNEAQWIQLLSLAVSKNYKIVCVTARKLASQPFDNDFIAHRILKTLNQKIAEKNSGKSPISAIFYTNATRHFIPKTCVLQYLQSIYSLDPQQILFIDDDIKQYSYARKEGFRVIFMREDQDESGNNKSLTVLERLLNGHPFPQEYLTAWDNLVKEKNEQWKQAKAHQKALRFLPFSSPEKSSPEKPESYCSKMLRFLTGQTNNAHKMNSALGEKEKEEQDKGLLSISIQLPKSP